MCVFEDGCEGVIREGWDWDVGENSISSCLVRIKKCAEDLISWNKIYFGYV